MPPIDDSSRLPPPFFNSLPLSLPHHRKRPIRPKTGQYLPKNLPAVRARLLPTQIDLRRIRTKHEIMHTFHDVRQAVRYDARQ